MDAIIDTGSPWTLIPAPVARSIGAVKTDVRKWVGGFGGGGESTSIEIVSIHFPTVEGVGFQDAHVRVSDDYPEAIVGLDVMTPLGIIVDTSTHTLKRRAALMDRIATAGETAVGVGGGLVAGYLVVKGIQALFAPDNDPAPPTTTAEETGGAPKRRTRTTKIVPNRRKKPKGGGGRRR